MALRIFTSPGMPLCRGACPDAGTTANTFREFLNRRLLFVVADLVDAGHSG